MKTEGPPFMCFPTTTPVQTGRIAHTHDFHEFIVATNDHGVQYAEGVRIAHRRGHVFCFPAGMAHCSSGDPRGPARAIVIWLSDSVFSPISYGDQETCRLLRRAFRLARDGHHPLPLSTSSGRRILSLASMMAREYQEGSPGYQSATRLLLQQILLLMMRDPGLRDGVGRPDSMIHHRQVDNVLRVLEGHFMEPIDIDRLARTAGISRSHFHAVFRAATGCTPIEYLTRVRIRAAQRLLRDSPTPVIQVAMDCGFASLSRFYEAFKSLTHQTPCQVRAGTGTR